MQICVFLHSSFTIKAIARRKLGKHTMYHSVNGQYCHKLVCNTDHDHPIDGQYMLPIFEKRAELLHKTNMYYSLFQF